MEGDPSVAAGWEAFAAASMDGVALVAGGDLVHANRALAALHGLDDPDALVGEPLPSLFADADRVDREVLPAVRESGAWRGSLSGVRRDGATFQATLSARGHEDGVVCVVRETPGGASDGPDLTRYESVVETVGDGVYALDADLRFAFVNDALCDIVGQPREAVLGTHVTEMFDSRAERVAADAGRERAVTGDDSVGTVEGTLERPDGETVHLEARYRLDPDPDGEFRGSVGVLRDVTDRVEREHRLERQRDELRTLGRITDLLFAITRELVETSTREGVERVVCERLAASSFYRFAWVGEPTGDGRVVPRASAGAGDGYLDAVAVTTDDGPTGDGPAGRALRSGQVAVVDDVATDPSFAPWREAALDRGFLSVAAVPLAHGGTTHGVLAVYAGRRDGFSEREQSGLATLGETVAFAVSAAENERMLFADAVVELTFDVADTDLLLAAAADHLDCRLALDGYVRTADGWLANLAVEGSRPERLADHLAGIPGVERTRVVKADGERGLVEVRLASGTFPDVLADAGAKVRTATADGGDARVVVEAPAAADVRDVVERVCATYPGAELLARRERDHPVTEVDLPGGPLDGLTDRQRQAVEIAYRAGYFEWPRTATAEEIAATMDISAPTFHAHLRKAERELVGRLLDDA